MRNRIVRNSMWMVAGVLILVLVLVLVLLSGCQYTTTSIKEQELVLKYSPVDRTDVEVIVGVTSRTFDFGRFGAEALTIYDSDGKTELEIIEVLEWDPDRQFPNQDFHGLGRVKVLVPKIEAGVSYYNVYVRCGKR